MLPCPTTGPSKEENVNEDICGGDDDNDEGADANVVRHPVQHALVVVMMMVTTVRRRRRIRIIIKQ